MPDSAAMPGSELRPLTAMQRRAVLAAAFLAWMFAGLEISLFILIHRQMMLGMSGAATPESIITRWFAWFQAAFLFGAAAGGWLFGTLGDSIGRTRALGLAVLCFSLFTLAAYPVDSVNGMLLLRFLACLGIGGVWPNAVSLAVEALPHLSRPLLAGILGSAANVGFVLLGLVGYVFAITPVSWRWTLLVGGAPVLIGVAILAWVQESPRWQAAKPSQAGPSAAPLRAVFQRPVVYRTLLGIGLGAIPVVGTAANANWLVPWTDHVAEQKAAAQSTPAAPKAADARGKAKTQLMRSGGAVFGSLLGGLFASLVGRRWSYFLISLGALALSSFIFTQLEPGREPSFSIFSFLLGFVGVTYFGWLPLFLPELFPTRVRSTGAGISFNTGRVVAGLVVLSAGFLIDRFGGNYRLVGFWSGMIYFAGMLLIWLAPRDAHVQLED